MNAQQHYSPVEASIFKKDVLDRIKLKNAKKRFKRSPQANQKPTVTKISW